MSFNHIATERSRALRRTSTRIKNSTKPTFTHRVPTFYHCPQCGEFLVTMGKNDAMSHITCCGNVLSALMVHESTDILAQQHQPMIRISGGFESNALFVTVGSPPHPMASDHRLEWIFIYTFQGGQFKLLPLDTPPEATFALASSDAYVYCDRPICKGKQCKFNCKRGFTAYTWCNQHGLWRYTL
ncbi:desulfoferrodoxin [Citrobacter sp. NCU1]|uniref:desulfoferrodoxin family protein n=1 Tax=Citrobacter sp. NCU1 TaxID=2026683 RepID=UPI0013911611|nr:desulfoferrodoxin family protein [Citrobacter sp. NCU1]NDO83673.1 desulfoferrodoxin [Citrobacter sp. NCU1]